MKRQWIKILLISISLTAILNATIYEDAEDGTTTKWEIYDNIPSGATMTNIVDTQKGKVIKFSGDALLNGFAIGGLMGQAKAWNNSSEKTLQWSMKTSTNFLIFISLKTSKGHRFLTYSALNYDSGFGHGLGTVSKDGVWRTFRRDLEADLKAVEADNVLLSVNGFLFRGNAHVDDIKLLNKNNLPPLISPIFSNDPVVVIDNSTIYEDAEDGLTKGWDVYDNLPAGATISNIVDVEKGKVIQLHGNATQNGYILGGFHGSTGAWNNVDGHILKWSMKYSENFIIFVSLHTQKGHRYLLYSASSQDNGFSYGLGTDAKDGTWRDFSRDLKADLATAEPDNTLLAVDAFLVRGSGRLDNIILEKGTVAPPPYIERVNLLEDKNSNINGTTGFTGIAHHEYNSIVTHTADGSGSIKLVGHWYTKQFRTASFHLEKGKHYTLGAYMKAIGSDKGQNVIFKISGAGHTDEMNWNVSKAGKWEEIVMPYRADVTGTYVISIFTFRYALTTDKKYALSNGANLDRSATMFFDDFYVHESQKIEPKEPYTPKVPYASSHVKIDALGNWSIKEDGVWRDFFPKFTYQDFTPSIVDSAKMYSSYGFTGFTNMRSAGRIRLAVENGMKYNGIQVNALNVSNSDDLIQKTIRGVQSDVASGQLSANAVIMYEYDNEQTLLSDYNQKRSVSDWLNAYDRDPISNKRARPINMLNGVAEGVARNYKNNSNKNYVDTVGTYIAQVGHSANKHLNPINTLGILQKTQNQIAPVSIMQLQCHYQDVFIPSIFKGIGAGAKGLNFWRAGAGVPSACQKNFESNVWVPVIKDIFGKIDTLLPVIKEPLNTTWTATVDNPTLVSVGTRDHAGKHYIILANFGYSDVNVDVNLKNLNTKTVRDFFSKNHLANVDENGHFRVNIGHHNNGFLVLELDGIVDHSPIANRLPVANAGTDKILFVNQTITIKGVGTDLDGTVVSYEWKNGATVLATTANFQYTPTTEGNVTLTLTVKDNKGGEATDTLHLTVKKKSVVVIVKDLLANKNGNLDGTANFTGVSNHEYNPIETHTADGSGSIKLVGHWYTKQFRTASFQLEKGKHYTLGAYMKAIGSDKGQNVIFKISGAGHTDEMNWNVSKAGKWEEIVMPYRADVTGTYFISIFTFRYALTTDKKYALSNGTNLDRSATMFFDDFYVHESQKIEPKEPYTPKVPYASSHVKIDALGNWSIKEDGVWRDFFPKFTYQDFTPSIVDSAKMYSSYGFTGFTNMIGSGRIRLAVENGMKYNGIQVNGMKVENPSDLVKKTIKDVNIDVASGKLPETSVIMYEYDNEQTLLVDYNQKKLVSDWLHANDKDPISQKRSRPVNMLNGVAEGVARNYKNSTNKDYLDTVSTYIAQVGHTTNQHLNPVNTLGILQKTQNQIAPVSIMQLQCHYQDVFIPSIFKGIGAGAKGLNFWRAGAGLPSACQKNFESNVWVPVIKDIFSKIDTMLPIIKEPVKTTWTATVDNPTLISVGTRNHAGKHYIILANFGYSDVTVDINLDKLNVSTVREYFTQTHLTTVADNGFFSVSIGHHNNGFLILELD